MTIRDILARIRGFYFWLEQSLLPSETLTQSKAKWNKLGRLNPRYYVWTTKGENITEDEISNTGLNDYTVLVKNDPIIRETLGEVSSRRALEVGCGIGRIAGPMARDFSQVDGIDISEELIRFGQDRLKHIQNVKLQSNDGVHFPFSPQTFDLVFSYLVFQHMADMRTVTENLREVGRVLKPGGIAKIQLRGRPIRKRAWSYGIWFTAQQALDVAHAAGLRPMQIVGEGEKNLWLWAQI